MEGKWFEHRGIFFALGIVQLILLTLFFLFFSEYLDTKERLESGKPGETNIQNK